MIEKMGMSDYVEQTNLRQLQGTTTTRLPRKSPLVQEADIYLHGRTIQGRR